MEESMINIILDELKKNNNNLYNQIIKKYPNITTIQNTNTYIKLKKKILNKSSIQSVEKNKLLSKLNNEIYNNLFEKGKFKLEFGEQNEIFFNSLNKIYNNLNEIKYQTGKKKLLIFIGALIAVATYYLTMLSFTISGILSGSTTYFMPFIIIPMINIIISSIYKYRKNYYKLNLYEYYNIPLTINDNKDNLDIYKSYKYKNDNIKKINKEYTIEDLDNINDIKIFNFLNKLILHNEPTIKSDNINKTKKKLKPKNKKTKKIIKTNIKNIIFHTIDTCVIDNKNITDNIIISYINVAKENTNKYKLFESKKDLDCITKIINNLSNASDLDFKLLDTIISSYNIVSDNNKNFKFGKRIYFLMIIYYLKLFLVDYHNFYNNFINYFIKSNIIIYKKILEIIKKEYNKDILEKIISIISYLKNKSFNLFSKIFLIDLFTVCNPDYIFLLFKSFESIDTININTININTINIDILVLKKIQLALCIYYYLVLNNCIIFIEKISISRIFPKSNPGFVIVNLFDKLKKRKIDESEVLESANKNLYLTTFYMMLLLIKYFKFEKNQYTFIDITKMEIYLSTYFNKIYNKNYINYIANYDLKTLMKNRNICYIDTKILGKKITRKQFKFQNNINNNNVNNSIVDIIKSKYLSFFSNINIKNPSTNINNDINNDIIDKIYFINYCLILLKQLFLDNEFIKSHTIKQKIPLSITNLIILLRNDEIFNMIEIFNSLFIEKHNTFFYPSNSNKKVS